MPSPSSSLSTLRPDLSGSFEEFNLAADRLGFVGTQVLPTFEVSEQAGSFGKIPVEALLQGGDNVVRAVAGNYNRAEYQFETDTFATVEYGAEEPIDDRESRMYRNYFELEMVARDRAVDRILRAYEIRVATAIFNATTFTSYTGAVTNEWDDPTNATPITDVKDAKETVFGNVLMYPNALLISEKVFNNLRECSQILDRIESAGAGFPARARDITTQQLAQVFDLDHIIVAGGGKNTGKEGQTITGAHIWDDEYAMLFRKATTNDIKEPCLGRTFHWAGDGSNLGGAVESYRDETVRADIIRARHDVQEKVLYTACGYLLSNITS